MKNQDLITKRLFSITICSCAILLCAGFFVFSIKTASAKHNEFGQLPQTGSIGKYMMEYITWMPEPNVLVRNILVWDTETGKSKRYTLNDSDEWVPASTQLPEKPL
jgi:hypothetical protein